MRFLANDLTLTREECLELLVRPKTHIALDIETVSIENTLMLGIGIALSPDQGFYFFDTYDELLPEIFASTDVVVTHNGKFDIHIMRERGYQIADFEDTKMLAYSAGILEHSLVELSASILHKSCPSVTSQWRKPNSGNIAIDHRKMGGMCITHACNTFALWEKIPKTDLYWEIDKPSVELVIEMEKWGLLINQHTLTIVEQQTMEQVLPLEKELLEELEIENLGSNPQVAEALGRLGIVGTRKTKSAKESVSSDSLKPLNLPLTDKILKFRSLMKTLTTYVPAFRGKIDHNGRLHTNFGLTSTGRWNSSKPNLQNITRNEKFCMEEE
ncbi:hypothetical protein LCGC14_1990740 [marine sediment metagenome]|uniref:3'-5' exonuclease domain-containing protein n=1 Tax=marine sediment metagenome TaxID=412755 RepID=A0A0F9F6F3_9ZZZZ